ncbi:MULTISPECIES: hypothetical protein [unclassified Streptomyces]|uniref:hypothetical protein n=1 Tax=unclassified Streptomyces TaxID=2593676 RepID=UPI001EF10328|nr:MULTISPECIES: hypothetical protein [unclassified Streptomyces]
MLSGTGSPSLSATTGVSIMMVTAPLSFTTAFRSFGMPFSWALPSSRSARASSLVAISSSNSVSASSTDEFSRCRTVVSSVAVRRGSASRRSVGACVESPYRASSACFTGGTRHRFSFRPSIARMSRARSSAAFWPRPEMSLGAFLHRSSTDTDEPSGTVSNPSSSRRNSGVTGASATE